MRMRMRMMKLLACFLVLVLVRTQEFQFNTEEPIAVDKEFGTPEELILTKEEQRAVDTKSVEQLDEEQKNETQFLAIDKSVSVSGSSVDLHRRFTFTSHESIQRGIQHRLRVIEVTKAVELKRIPPGDVASVIKKGLGPQVFCGDNCTCDINSPYRTADGSCNNKKHPTWGQRSTPFRRWLNPAYDDGVSSPRQMSLASGVGFLPSARTISYRVHKASGASDYNQKYTHMLMQWGQFLDHDITATPSQQVSKETSSGYTGGSRACCSILFTQAAGISQAQLDSRPECFPIKVESWDPDFSTCMNFVRSVQVENADCLAAPVEQLNQITAYIDGSQIYGSSQKEQNELRDKVNKMGLLKVKTGTNYLPADNEPSCATPSSPDYCFRAGDKRVNENPGLQSIHTVFMREHNRIAKQLKKINCHWDDERLFQEARKIVGAILQDITYDEYLPIILGNATMTTHGLHVKLTGHSTAYDESVDASIRNAFATAAYRFGHSMIRSKFSSFNSAYSSLGSDLLRNSYGHTGKILSQFNRDVGHYHRGFVQDFVQAVDGKLTEEVTKHLFRDGTTAFDLAALNIQRGRDHGLPSYMYWRKACGKNYVTSFTALSDTHSNSAITLLQSAYSTAEDIDLFTGGLTETPLTGALVGPTFSCLLTRQFKVLKVGDRFWFEENNDKVAFTLAQITELRKASLSRVICDNTDTTSIQKNAFIVDSNKLPCYQLPSINLWKWKDLNNKWSDWSKWGGCKEGIATRTRTCQPCNCGCEGLNADAKPCNVIQTSCTWSPWGNWGTCFKTQKRRNRQCSCCPGSSTQYGNCYAYSEVSSSDSDFSRS